MKTINLNRFLDYLHWIILFIFDTAAVIFCFWLGYQLWVQSSFRIHPSPPVFNFLSFLFGAIIFSGILIWGGTYKLQSSVIHVLRLKNLIRLTFIGYAIVLVVGFFTKSMIIGRLQAVYILLLLIPSIIFERALIDSLWANLVIKRLGQKRILIYGAGDTGKRLAKAVEKHPKLSYKIVGFLDDGKNSDTIMTINPLPVLGGLKELPSIVKSKKIDKVWIAIPKAPHTRVLSIMKICDSLDIQYRFVPSLHELALHRVRMDDLDGVPLFGIKTLGISFFNNIVKGIFDLLFSVISLIILIPFFGFIGLLIKRDSPGPVIFRQKRVGLNGKEFTMFKFRTLYIDTPPYAINPMSRDDPRITNVGRFLRRTSLDELPQFWNILKGEMSVVGPRPEMPFIVKEYNDVHRERLNVKPGITCLWQISGDRALPIHENIDHDLYYIEHQSLLLDIIIIFETIIFALKGIGAH